MAKINITLSDDILEQIDYFANKTGMSRSGFISLSSRIYMDSMRFTDLLDELTSAVKRLGTGEDDEQILSEINKLITCLNMIQNKPENKEK